MKLGLTYPLPENLIREFAEGVKKLFVVEELDPYLEEQIKALGIAAIGKERFPICGELSPEIVKQGMSGKRRKKPPAPTAIPPRPPALCPGCPHSATFYTIKKLKLKCKNGKLKVTIKSKLPAGVELTVLVNGVPHKVVINNKGKGKLKLKNRTGLQEVVIEECDVSNEIDCG